MTLDNYTYIIIALLPLSALMLVTQINPYHALVIRAILGAVAALVYAVLGAADVALTEALVGTMLAVTLYVIAVRSSLVMRLGILKEETNTQRRGDESKQHLIKKDIYLQELIASLKKVINKYHLRLELIEYPNLPALEAALKAKEVHAVCTQQEQLEPSAQNNTIATDIKQTYNTTVRVPRLFEIMQGELIPETTLTYVAVTNMEEKH